MRYPNRAQAFAIVIFLILFILKLTYFFEWSWWLVTTPLWLPWIFAGTFVGILGAIIIIEKCLEKFLEKFYEIMQRM